MTQIGDILAKMGTTLTEEEKGALRLWGNQSQLANSFVGGLQNGGSDVFANTLNSNTFPFGVIHSNVLASDTTTLSITIPSKYKHLMIMGTVRSTYSASAIDDRLQFRFNNDSGANYDWNYLQTVDGVVSGGDATGQTFGVISIIPPDGAPAGHAGSFFSIVPHYGSALIKMAISHNGADHQQAQSFYGTRQISVWQSTAPVTDISFYLLLGGNLKAGSAVSIYGLG